MAPARLTTTNGSGDWITPYPPYPKSIRLVLRTRMFRKTMVDTGVGDEPEWIKRMMDGWEADVISLLDTLNGGTWTERTVMADINRECAQRGHTVFIYPREYSPAKTPSGGKDELEILDLVLNSAVDGNTHSGLIPAGGEAAWVYFDPATWRADSFIRQEAAIVNPAKFGGVGMEPRTVLLHELVHADRRVKGITDRTRTKNTDYVNLEEFTAVLVSNIATSERDPSTPLRYGERTFLAMSAQHKTSAGFLRNPEHADIVKQLVARDSALSRNIGNSPTQNPFNPFRRAVKGALWPAPRADW